jgi:hypothetical protein
MVHRRRSKHLTAMAQTTAAQPSTKATAAWYAKMKESTAEWLARYEAMIRDRDRRQSAA